MQIRRLGPDDVDLSVELRLTFLSEHHRAPAAELGHDFVERTARFLRRRSDADELDTWVAESSDGALIGGVTSLLYEMPPRPFEAREREGYIVNMWVAPSWRGQGIGRALLTACRAGAVDRDLRRLWLMATDDGRPLYESTGFAANDRWLELPLTVPGGSGDPGRSEAPGSG